MGRNDGVARGSARARLDGAPAKRATRRSNGTAARRILDYLSHSSPTTRSSIAAATGLATSTVNTALKALIGRGEVVPCRGTQAQRAGERGRPGTLVSIAGPPVAAIDVGAEVAAGTLLLADGTTLTYASTRVDDRTGLTHDDLVAVVARMSADAAVPVDAIGTLVVTVPRSDDVDPALVRTWPVASRALDAMGGAGLPVRGGPPGRLRQLRVRYATDTRALGELSRRGPGSRSFVFVQLVPSVDFAVVLQGRLVERSRMRRDRSAAATGGVWCSVADDPDATAIAEVFHGAPSMLGTQTRLVRDLSSVPRSVASASLGRLGGVVGEQLAASVAFLDLDEVVVDGSLGRLMAPFETALSEAIGGGRRPGSGPGPTVTSGLPLDAGLAHGALRVAGAPGPGRP